MMLRLLAALLLLPLSVAAQTVDYQIDNQPGATFRAELNNHLGAILQHNSGLSPRSSTILPYMVWADTSGADPTFRYRNAANNAWRPAFRITAGAVDWIGSITSASATITGGAIDGTTIGATAPAPGTFTQAEATRLSVSTSSDAVIDLRRTDDFNSHEITRLGRENNLFTIKTRTNTGAFVATDYEMTVGSGGATEHSFRTAGTERFEIGTAGTIVRNGFLLVQGATTLDGAVEAGTIIPRADNAESLGSANPFRRWQSIYLVNSPIVTSDARLKVEIGNVAAAECRVADRIEVRRYKMADDPDGPWRFGAIAQDVIAAFEAEGLDWQDYAIVTGSETGGYGIAYDELQNLKLACL